MDPFQSLFSDLRSPDTSIRLSVLSRIEGLEWNDEQLAAFQKLIGAEKDPGTRFHMQKIMARVEKLRLGKDTPAGNKSQEIEAILKAPELDGLALAMALESIKRSEAPLIAISLREARWPEFPDEVLPFLLQFFKKYGSFEDSEAIELLCRHPDARVLASAVEALEKLNPEGLKPLIVPLLASSINGIRTRAIKLLARWDPQEALNHFESMVFSADGNERQAALFHAFFFPFEDIRPLLIRLLGVENDVTMIPKIGYLFRANPDPEVLVPLIEVMEASREEKRKGVGEILSGVVVSLSQAGLIEKSPEEIMTDLKAQYRQKKARHLLERCTLALTSPHPQNRKAAIAKLLELARAGFSEAGAMLTEHHGRETDPELKTALDAALGIETIPVPAAVSQEYAQQTPTDRLQTLAHLTPDRYAALKPQLFSAFTAAPQEEKVLLIQMIGHHGGANDAEFLLKGLEDPDPSVVTVAVETLQSVHPDSLFPFLSRLLAHDAEEIRTSAIRALALFDKKQALELIEEMLLAVQPQRRSIGIFSATQLDFPSTRQLLVKALEKEESQENLRQFQIVFQENADKDLLVDIIRIHRSLSGSPEKQGFLEALIQGMAKRLIKSGKTNFSDPAELISSIDRKLAEDAKKKTEGGSAYSVDSIRKMRQNTTKIAVVKPSDPLQVLSNDLRSSDPAMRFSVLSRIEAIEWTTDRVAAFKTLAEKEKDPGTRFHMQKILARITGTTDGVPVDRVAELGNLLKKTPRDDMGIALLLESVSRKEGPKVLELLRVSKWETLTIEVLPFVLQFFKKFGNPEDLPTIEKLCKQSDSRVLAAAIEVIEKLNPDSLKAQIVPLLVNPNQGIRSRAIRLLHRWDPQEALKHFEAMLFSDEPNDRQAALFQAFFFPFAEIEPLMLRFLGVEKDKDVLEKAGFLFRANPMPEDPLRIIDVMESSAGEKRSIIGEILNGVVNSLSQAGLIQASPEEIMSDLLVQFKQKKITNLIEGCRLALQSEDVENRQSALAKLTEMARRGLPEARDLLSQHAAGEKNQELKTSIQKELGLSTIEIKAVTESFEKASPDQRLQILSRLDKKGLEKLRPRLRELLKKGNLDERILLVQVLGREGTAEDANLLIGLLNDPEPKFLAVVIETLKDLDPDLLSPYLPKLIQHPQEEVRVVAIKVFALFDKKQALALVETMLFSIQPRSRHSAIFLTGQFDFPSVRELLLKALAREQDLDNFRQIGLILKGNLDEDLYVRIMSAHNSSGGAQADYFEELEKETAQTLIKEHKTQHQSPQALKAFAQKRIQEDDLKKKATQPSYSLSNIQKMRQEQQAAAQGIDPGLVRFTIAAFSIGAVLTAVIWFLILAPSPKAKKKKKPTTPEVTKTHHKAPAVGALEPTDITDITGTITAVEKDGKSFYVKPDPKAPLEYYIILKSAPLKPYEKGKPFKGQVKPVKKYGDTVQSELLMTY